MVVCWIKKVMIDVGIDMNIFSVYSICFVVISVVKFVGMLFIGIMNVVGWFNLGIFYKFYYRIVNSDNFGLLVLFKYFISDNLI